MAQYIEKDALVAEIEKLIQEIYAGQPFDSLSRERQVALWHVKSILTSVNNLEVKDEQPNLTEEEQVGMGGLGMVWQKKHLIDGACERLRKMLYIHTETIEDIDWGETKTIDWVTSDYDSVNDFIDGFRKAMEE